MTLNEWCWEEKAIYRSIENEDDLFRLIKDTWNAAQEEARKEKINECNALLEELYPLRQTNKEQTNENR